jgi:hypothetical protein
MACVNVLKKTHTWALRSGKNQGRGAVWMIKGRVHQNGTGKDPFEILHF